MQSVLLRACLVLLIALLAACAPTAPADDLSDAVSTSEPGPSPAANSPTPVPSRTATTPATPVIPAPSQGGGSTPEAAQGDVTALTKCVTEAAGEALADAIEIVNGMPAFSQEMSPASLSPDQMTAVMACIQPYGPVAGLPPGLATPPAGLPPALTPPPGMIPPSGLTPPPGTSLPPGATPPPGFTPPPGSGPGPTPPPSADQAAFRACVSGVAGESAAGAIEVIGGNLTFSQGFNPAGLTQDAMSGIMACARQHGLLSGGTTSGPGGSGQGASTGVQTAAQQEFQACIAGTHLGNVVPSVTLTAGGLPDFSSLGQQTLSVPQFQALIDCVPALGSNIPPQPLGPEVRAIAQSVADGARQSVVYIETDGGGLGAGFFISDTGLILTNHHVVAGAGSITVWLADGRRFDASLLGGEPIPDIAVVQVSPLPTGVMPLTIGTAAGLTQGDVLVTVGHPGGVGSWVATVGDFLEFEKTDLQLLEGGRGEVTDIISAVPAGEGNSGSPLLDLEGRVVGVVYGGSPRNPTRVDGRPQAADALVREFVVSTMFTRTVPIEHALRVAADVTGDQSLVAGLDMDLPVTEPGSTLTPADRSCLGSVLGTLADGISLTSGGLPDFSGMGSATLSATQFEGVVDCLPAVHLAPSPITLVETARAPAFSTDVRAAAQSLGEKVRESVVYLDLGGTALATGYLISQDGLILTNQHNIDGITGDIKAWLLDGRSFVAEVLGSVAQPDVALLKIDAPPDIVPLTIGTSTGLQADQPLIVVGNPGAMGNWVITLGSFDSLSAGAVDLQGNPVRELVITTPTTKGNSGSPVLDLEGNVVGMIWGARSPGGRKPGDSEPPMPATAEVREFLTTVDLSLAVAIEEAMALVEEWR